MLVSKQRRQTNLSRKFTVIWRITINICECYNLVLETQSDNEIVQSSESSSPNTYVLLGVCDQIQMSIKIWTQEGSRDFRTNYQALTHFEMPGTKVVNAGNFKFHSAKLQYSWRYLFVTPFDWIRQKLVNCSHVCTFSLKMHWYKIRHTIVKAVKHESARTSICTDF